MKTSARSRFWIRKGQHQRPHAVEKSRNKREGRPRSFPQLTSFPSHLCRTARASHPIAPPPSHVPLFVNCHTKELAPWAQAIHGAWLISRRSLFPSRPTKRNEGEGGRMAYGGVREKQNPHHATKKKPLSNGRIATVLRGLQRPWRKAPLPPFACLGNPAEEGPLSQPRNPARNRPRRRRCCSGCSGEMDSSSEDRQTQLSKNRERGVQGSSPAPPNPHPYFPSVRP